MTESCAYGDGSEQVLAADSKSNSPPIMIQCVRLLGAASWCAVWQSNISPSTTNKRHSTQTNQHQQSPLKIPAAIEPKSNERGARPGKETSVRARECTPEAGPIGSGVYITWRQHSVSPLWCRQPNGPVGHTACHLANSKCPPLFDKVLNTAWRHSRDRFSVPRCAQMPSAP